MTRGELKNLHKNTTQCGFTSENYFCSGNVFKEFVLDKLQ